MIPSAGTPDRACIYQSVLLKLVLNEESESVVQVSIVFVSMCVQIMSLSFRNLQLLPVHEGEELIIVEEVALIDEQLLDVGHGQVTAVLLIVGSKCCMKVFVLITDPVPAKQ